MRIRFATVHPQHLRATKIPKLIPKRHLPSTLRNRPIHNLKADLRHHILGRHTARSRKHKHPPVLGPRRRRQKGTIRREDVKRIRVLTGSPSKPSQRHLGPSLKSQVGQNVHSNRVGRRRNGVALHNAHLHRRLKRIKGLRSICVPKNRHSIRLHRNRVSSHPSQNRIIHRNLKGHRPPRRLHSPVPKLKRHLVRLLVLQPTRPLQNSHDKRPSRIVPRALALKQARVRAHTQNRPTRGRASQPTQRDQAASRNVGAERQRHSQLSHRPRNRVVLTNLVDLKTRRRRRRAAARRRR